MIQREVFLMVPCWVGDQQGFPNRLIMQVGMELSDILFLFIVLVSFQFSQLAQVVFYLTL